MRLDVNEFQKHVDSMTDEEVRESIEKALRMTSGLNQDDWTILSNESDPTFKNNKWVKKFSLDFLRKKWYNKYVR